VSILKRRKAFTLVELLIVIIIIGILAGGLLLAAGKSQNKAQAIELVSNMKTLKTATLQYYADNLKWFEQGNDGWGVLSVRELESYLDREMEDPFPFASKTDWSTASENPFFIYVSGPAKGKKQFETEQVHVYIAANVTNDYYSYDVRKKLEDMSPETGIYDGNYSEGLEEPDKHHFEATENPSSTNDKFILMRVK